jgi:hypothetical protein
VFAGKLSFELDSERVPVAVSGAGTCVISAALGGSLPKFLDGVDEDNGDENGGDGGDGEEEEGRLVDMESRHLNSFNFKNYNVPETTARSPGVHKDVSWSLGHV